jgi:uncharacterized repeat protein (TIGR01451 family)
MTTTPNLTLGKTPARRGAKWAAMGVAMLMACPALAQDAPQDIAIALETFKLVQTVDATGATRIERETPDSVLPGDRILYRIALSNPGEDAATDLALDLPIHEALVVAPESFAGDVAFEVTFATQIAPEEFMAFPELAVPLPDGGTRPATPEDLGAVRVFIAELSALEAAFVEYEANVR